MNIPVLVFNDITGQYIAGIEAQRGKVSVARHIHDVGELMGIAQTGIARAALVVGSAEQLNATSIATLVQCGVAVIVLRDPGEEIQLSCEDIVSSLATIDEIIECIEKSVETISQKQSNISQSIVQEPVVYEADIKEEVSHNRNGKIIAFWGASGSPGRSTMTIQVSGFLAQQNRRVCIIDADTYSSSIAGMLGITEDYSALSQLAHYAEKGQLTPSNFQKTISCIKHGKASFDVVTGTSNADRWIEIRQATYEKILEVAQSIYDFVLVDVNHLVEFDEELSFDGLAPLRNCCTLTTLEYAQHICAIGAADPIGIPRLLKALEQLEEKNIFVSDDAVVHPWINKVRASSVGSNPEQQIENAWTRYGGKYAIEGFIDWEPEIFDKALLTGQTVFELNRSHPVCDSISQLAQTFVSEDTVKDTHNNKTKDNDAPSVIIRRPHQSSKHSWFHRKLFAGKQP